MQGAGIVKPFTVVKGMDSGWAVSTMKVYLLEITSVEVLPFHSRSTQSRPCTSYKGVVSKN